MPVIDEKQELAKKSDLATKQDILTAGTGITIQNNVISSTGGSTVTVTPVLSTGTRIAAIEVDGTIYTLFAPTPPSVGVTQIQQSGVELARVTIDNTPYSIYAPEGSTILSGTSAPTAAQGENGDLYVQYTVTNSVYTVDMTYVKLNDGWIELSAGGGGSGNVDDVYVNGTSVLDSNKIAQITSYKEVTQAEYDALPATKLTDNILYCIKDQATADTTVAPVIYSEEEREIGVWTDGKPLYEKTIITQNISTLSSWVSIAHGITNFEKCVNLKGMVYRQSDGWSIPINYWEDTTAWVAAGITNESSHIDLKIKISTGVYDAYITIQYTKTTDTPGSGKYAPSGIPAVHYSTDEQVVGTWIDGSTIYEKTFEFSSQLALSANNWTNSSATVTGISNILDIIGYDSTAAFRLLGARPSNDTIQLFATTIIGISKITIRYTKTTT